MFECGVMDRCVNVVVMVFEMCEGVFEYVYIVGVCDVVCGVVDGRKKIVMCGVDLFVIV